MKEQANLTTMNEYKNFIIDIKSKIKLSQTKAIAKVNQEMIVLYFTIGKTIYQKQQEFGWGAKIIDNLSKDIKVTFPDLGGFSVRNIKLMLQFYREYSDLEIVQLSDAQIENKKVPLLQMQTKEFECSLPTIEMIEDEFNVDNK